MCGNCTKLSLLSEALIHNSTVSAYAGQHILQHSPAMVPALTTAGHGQGDSWSTQVSGNNLSMLSLLEGKEKHFGLGETIPDISFLVVEVMLLRRRFSVCQGLWVKAEKEN